MTANMRFLRPLAIVAGVLGCLQAIIWGVLSLLGILVYTGAIQPRIFSSPTDHYLIALLYAYFIPNTPVIAGISIMTPGTVVVWTSIYFATSVIWLWISALLLNDSCKSKFTRKIIIGWVAVSAVVAVIDFAGTIAFSLDYNTVQSHLHNTNSFIQSVPSVTSLPFPQDLSNRRTTTTLRPQTNRTTPWTTTPRTTTTTLTTPPFSPFLPSESLATAILMMTVMCARGFILWIMNVGLVIYLGVAARNKLNKKGSPKPLQDPEHLSRRPSVNSNYYSSIGPSLVSPHKADSPSKGRMNPAFQPETIYDLDIQSQTMGNQQRNKWDFPPQYSPSVNDVVNPHDGNPVVTPTAPPLIPPPDYNTALRLPVKNEPDVYDGPIQSVLEKPNSTGGTLM